MKTELCKKFCGVSDCPCMREVWFEIEQEQQAGLIFKGFLTSMVGVLIAVVVLFVLVLLFAP